MIMGTKLQPRWPRSHEVHVGFELHGGNTWRWGARSCQSAEEMSKYLGTHLGTWAPGQVGPLVDHVSRCGTRSTRRASWHASPPQGTPITHAKSKEQ